jgi:hypothetical protein
MKRLKPSGNFSEIFTNCVPSRRLRIPVRFPLNHIFDLHISVLLSSYTIPFPDSIFSLLMSDEITIWFGRKSEHSIYHLQRDPVD